MIVLTGTRTAIVILISSARQSGYRADKALPAPRPIQCRPKSPSQDFGLQTSARYIGPVLTATAVLYRFEPLGGTVSKLATTPAIIFL